MGNSSDNKTELPETTPPQTGRIIEGRDRRDNWWLLGPGWQPMNASEVVVHPTDVVALKGGVDLARVVISGTYAVRGIVIDGGEEVNRQGRPINERDEVSFRNYGDEDQRLVFRQGNDSGDVHVSIITHRPEDGREQEELVATLRGIERVSFSDGDAVTSMDTIEDEIARSGGAFTLRISDLGTPLTDVPMTHRRS